MQIHLKIRLASLPAFTEEIRWIPEGEACVWEENRLNIAGAIRHSNLVCLNAEDKIAWFVGDPILEDRNESAIHQLLAGNDYAGLLKTVNGHYRLIVLDKRRGTIVFSSSLFGIFPLFYFQAGDFLYVSTDTRAIALATGQTQLNKRFILENLLFYYPLFNETVYKNIRRLSAHQLLEGSATGTRLTKFFDITDWFVESPQPWKTASGDMADLFIDRVKHYLPSEPYIHALTGGFDGRTLTACGLYHERPLETYGFGVAGSDDTRIAAQLASIAHLKFNFINLDNDYLVNHSLKNGLEFIVNSGGHAGFARAHYLFSAKNLGRRARCLVTGNFGSEIFRAAHNAGAVISGNLYRLFRSRSPGQAFRLIEASPEFNWINRVSIRQEWEELKSDLIHLPVFDSLYQDRSPNEKFYAFVFEEVFRKYFGPEMISQSRYINNRTPFLDAVFLKEILRTGLAGVHSRFFEQNPVLRYKGQVLYAHVIKKAFPSFNEVLTDKGYRPKDLLTPGGKFHIVKNYISKRITRRAKVDDPHQVSRAFAYNRRFFQGQMIHRGIFNYKQFRRAFDSGHDSHDFLIAVSQSWFANRVMEPAPAKEYVSSNTEGQHNLTDFYFE